MTELETMAGTLEEWASAAGADAFTPFDGEGVARGRFGEGLEATFAVRGDVYASAVAGTLAGCADRAKVCAAFGLDARRMGGGDQSGDGISRRRRACRQFARPAEGPECPVGELELRGADAGGESDVPPAGDCEVR